MTEADNQESDYINASYVYKEKDSAGNISGDIQCIAAQSPLENTVNDFWKMIWQEGTQYIIMLTDVYTYSEVIYLTATHFILTLKRELINACLDLSHQKHLACTVHFLKL